ncbi:hypothetical protein ABMA27_008197 [Loxostege sticticalis]|uniref:Gustatory receptor n=1 Tax=Loxostege sticticalis TaxID=481309 RepID=A0ABR3HEA0_LOXSC
MRFTLFKVVPLDWSLPVLILNLNDRDADYCLAIYKSIAISMEAAKTCFDYLYVISLLLITPGLILQVYLGLERLKEAADGDSVYYLVLRSLYAIQNYVILCSPAVSAGLVTSAVEELKLILHEKLLHERGKEQEPQIQIFLDYVTGRPMRLTLFEVVPLDWSLPVLILNLCISYQIIIVQFTKLY